jgi:hypothetical protein
MASREATALRRGAVEGGSGRRRETQAILLWLPERLEQMTREAQMVQHAPQRFLMLLELCSNGDENAVRKIHITSRSKWQSGQ